jgi:hypothetical protein
MKMDGVLQPIQGEFKKREITLKNLVNPLSSGITLKVEEIFTSFAKKTSSYQQIEYLQGGVRNWNAIHLGSMNGKTKTLDTISSDSILRELRSKAPLISFDEDQIKERYKQSGFIPLKEGQWAIALRASRLKPNLNMLEAHGYIELIYKENDRYFALPMGVQPVHLPEKVLAKLFFLTATNKAGIHYPDESFFLSQRQQMGLFFPLSEQEEVRLQYTIASMQQSSEENHLLFQFAGKNCAFHIQRIFDQVIAAPFYEKIQDIADRAFSEGNFLSEAIDRITFKRAFEGLNHELLNTTLKKITDHLWKNHRQEELRQLCALSASLLSKVHQRTIHIDSQKIHTNNPRCKQAIQTLLKETIETIRFYRMDLFRVETDQGILSSLNKVIKLIPSRLLKRLLTNVFLFLIGSWRWMIVKKDTVIPTKKTDSDLQISSTAGNPLVQEGYLNHPAALWEWLESKDVRISKINKILAVFQTL